MKRKIFTLLMALFSVIAIQAQVRYVTENGEGDGTSWENASGDIQRMIDELDEAGGGEIRVAQGNYVPMEKISEVDVDGNLTTERDKAFALKSNIKIYGGYNSDGSERDTEKYTTILSGAINQTDTAYHVLVAVQAENVVLDGLMITNGRAYYSSNYLVTGSVPNELYKKNVWPEFLDGNAKVPHNALSRGQGAGLLAHFSKIKMNDVYFTNNGTGAYGGIVTFNVCEVEIRNSLFSNNFSDTDASDAGIFSNRTDLTVSDLAFKNNRGNLIRVPNNFTNTIYPDKLGEVYIKNITIEDNQGSGGMTLTQNIKVLSNIQVKNSAFAFSISNLKSALTVQNFSIIDCTNLKETDSSSMLVVTGCYEDYITWENLLIENCTSTFIVTAAASKNKYKKSQFINNRTLPTTIQSKGGIFYTYGQSCETFLEDCIVSGNTSSSINYSTTSVPSYKPLFTSINSLFISNVITNKGFDTPALFQAEIERKNSQTYDNSVILLNNTIVNNRIKGTSLGYIINVTDQSNATNTTIQNSIIWGNTNENNNAATLDYLSEITVSNSLIESFDLSSSNYNLDGTQSANHYFVNAAGGDFTLIPFSTNPAVNGGNDTFINSTVTKDIAGNARYINTIDIGAYEAQEVIDPFTGGTLNEEGEREFIYTEDFVALLLQPNIGGTATFSYKGLDEWSNDSGSGLPTETGLYTVTASITGGDYNGSITSTIVRINKAELAITFPEIPSMRVADADHGTHTLTSTNAEGLEVEFSIVDGTSVSLSGNELTAIAEGSAIIAVNLKETHRNYVCTTSPTRTVFVQSAADDDATLATVTVNGQEAVWEIDKYTVSVPYSETITINGTPTSSLSEVTDNSTGKTLEKGQTITITLTVKAENQSTEDYTLEVSTQNDIATLDKITVAGKEATLTGGAYAVTIPYTLEAAVELTPTDSKATVTGGNTPTVKNLILGDNVRSFTVVAEDGTQASYQLTINVLNNNANVRAITVKVGDAEASEISADTNGEYYITVAHTTAITLLATALDGNAVVSGQTGNLSVVKGLNTFTVTITSEDGTTSNTYTVKVTVPLNSDTSLKEVKVNGKAAKLNNGQYEYIVISSTATTAVITATATDDFATVSGTGTKDINPGTNTIILAVTAEDGTIGYHTLVVTVQTDSPSDPDPAPVQPVVTITGQLPEGVTIEPGLGEHTVREGQSLTLTINLGDQYDGMYVFLKINDEYIPLEPVLRSSVYTYTIENIRENMTIGIHISQSPDPNPDPVDNVTIEGGAQLWTADGYLYIQISGAANVSVVSMAGRIVTSQKISAGEASISLTKGIYMVKVDNNVTKIIVR